MNDQILEELLDRSVERVPDRPPPLGDILGQARSARTHRRGALLGSAAAVLAVITGVALAPRVMDDATAPTSTSVPEPPAGKKWAGVGDTVVAVPDSWPVVPGVYCTGPSFPYVTIVEAHVAVPCPAVPDAGPPSSSVDLFASKNGQLSGTYGFAHVGLDKSRMRLPSGWLAVPTGGPAGGVGTPALTDEITALRSAGFRVVVRTADPLDQWRAVTTDPEIGTPARIGSTVIVYDRGTHASSAELRGRVQWVGGFAPGNPQPHPGIVHVVNGDGSVDQTVATDARGRWSIQVPPGTYEVEATSPGFGSVRGANDACTAGDPVTLRTHQSAHVDVSCQMR